MTINLNGHTITINSGGINVDFFNKAHIGGGKLTSSADFIDFRYHEGKKGHYRPWVNLVISDSNNKVGIRISGRNETNELVIRGRESNTYTGDTIVSGWNTHLGLGKENEAKAVQGNIVAEEGGSIRFDNNNQLSESSVVTLKKGNLGFIEYKPPISNSAHQLRIEEQGTIHFGRTSLRENAQRFLYIDDLIISPEGILNIIEWQEGRDFLLVRKESAHLKEALGKIIFEGYDRNAIHLENYNKDYWSISASPEPATYGVILRALSLGLVAYRRRNRDG